MRRVIRVLLGVLLVLGLSVAGFIVLNWAPDRPVEELQARWAPAPSQFIELMGMQVHLRDEGPRDDAEPLLLLHGTSASLHTWEGWVADLKRTRRVISVDLPGFGLTGPFPDGTTASPTTRHFSMPYSTACKCRRWWWPATVSAGSWHGNWLWLSLHVSVG